MYLILTSSRSLLVTDVHGVNLPVLVCGFTMSKRCSGYCFCGNAILLFTRVAVWEPTGHWCISLHVRPRKIERNEKEKPTESLRMKKKNQKNGENETRNVPQSHSVGSAAFAAVRRGRDDVELITRTYRNGFLPLSFINYLRMIMLLLLRRVITV